MAQTPSIPQKHHTDVIKWWLTGLSPRKVSARLLKEYGVVTSHTSVLRVVDDVADGRGDEAVVATVTRLRLRSTALLSQLEAGLSLVCVEAGLEERSAETPMCGSLNLRLLDLADRIAIRHLRLAGVGGRAGERLVEKYEAQQRQLADERCALSGVTWPFQQPSEAAAAEQAPATPPPRPVATQAETPRASPASTLPPTASRPPGKPPVTPPPESGTQPSSATDSVRMASRPSAVVAETDASALDQRTPSQPPPEVIPTTAPRRPCPCGSGLRYKHCHGKQPTPSAGEPAQRTLTRNAA